VPTLGRRGADVTQVFHPVFNTISRVTIFGALAFVVAGVWLLMAAFRSDYETGVGVAREQPIQFSHQHHVAADGIDCRYCHWSVEDGSFAGIPATEVCMSCHVDVWAQSATLEPVRASLRTGEPLRWVRVHDLPDYVHFDHGIHVRKGVGCVSCHGRVDEMPIVRKTASLAMEWCLACHRDPEPAIRPASEVFAMTPRATERGEAVPHRSELTDCSICHQ
jgi:Cytochrome c7 and related cytochrome c